MQQKKTLIEGTNSVGKDQIENFIKYFLCISHQTLEKFFEVSEVVRVSIDKTFDVKNQHKSNKDRSQVVNKEFSDFEKLLYKMTGKTRKIRS